MLSDSDDAGATPKARRPKPQLKAELRYTTANSEDLFEADSGAEGDATTSSK